MATLRTAHRPGAAFFLPSCPELSLQPPSPPPAPQPASASHSLGLRGQPPSGAGYPVTASWDFLLLSQALPLGIHCLPHQTKPPHALPRSREPAACFLAPGTGEMLKDFLGKEEREGGTGGCVSLSLCLCHP